MIFLGIFAGSVALLASLGLYVEFRNKRKATRRQEMSLRITIARLKARSILQQEKNRQFPKNKSV